MSDFDQRPAVIAGACAVSAALVATAASALATPSSIGLGLFGSGLLALALYKDVAIAYDIGPFVLFAGVIQSGVQSGSMAVTLVATIAVVVAWDLGHTARDIGRQLGREATTTRLEIARLLSSLTIGVLSTTIGYGIFVAAREGESNAALAALIGTVFFATIALGSGNREVRPTTR